MADLIYIISPEAHLTNLSFFDGYFDLLSFQIGWKHFLVGSTVLKSYPVNSFLPVQISIPLTMEERYNNSCGASVLSLEYAWQGNYPNITLKYEVTEPLLLIDISYFIFWNLKLNTTDSFNIEWNKFAVGAGVSLQMGGYSVLNKIDFEENKLYEDLKNNEIEKIKSDLKNGKNINQQDSAGNTALILAARDNNNELINFLIENGADVNLTNQNGHTALSMSLLKSSEINAMILIRNGADIYRQYSLISEDSYSGSKEVVSNNSALILACMKNMPQTARLLIEKGLDIQLINSTGNSALIYASGHEQMDDIVKLLVQKGADIHLKNRYGNTSLLIALDNRNPAAAQFLIENGAEINRTNTDGFTPLSAAIHSSEDEIASLLIKKGSVIAIKNKNHESLLYQACDNRLTNTALLLISKGIEVNDPDDETPVLIEASDKNMARVVQMLLKHGAKVNTKDKSFGKTALIQAVYKGNMEIIKLLIKYGADINISKNDKEYPLQISLEYNYHDIASYLLEKESHANIYFDSWNRKNALHLSAEKGYIDIVKILINKKININAIDYEGNTALISACRYSQSQSALFLINQGADIFITNNDGNNAFMTACQNDLTDISELLIMKGVNLELTNKWGETAFIIAWNNHYHSNEFIQMLINKGVDTNKLFTWLCGKYDSDDNVEKLKSTGYDVNSQDKNGRTGLMEACRHGNIKFVHYLLENKALPDLIDNDGRTALMEASEYGYIDIVNQLLQNRADVNIKSQDGSTALSLALKKGYKKIIDMLIQAGAIIDN